MSDNKVSRKFWYYLNPLVWIRLFVSYTMTIVLVINHFFVLILASVIVVLTALFFYDRYAVLTYDEDPALDGENAFAAREKYDSPLARGDRYLSKELAALYDAEERQNAYEKEVVEREMLERQSNQNSAIRDMKPIWGENGVRPPLSISEEVRRRISSTK